MANLGVLVNNVKSSFAWQYPTQSSRLVSEYRETIRIGVFFVTYCLPTFHENMTFLICRVKVIVVAVSEVRDNCDLQIKLPTKAYRCSQQHTVNNGAGIKYLESLALFLVGFHNWRIFPTGELYEQRELRYGNSYLCVLW